MGAAEDAARRVAPCRTIGCGNSSWNGQYAELCLSCKEKEEAASTLCALRGCDRECWVDPKTGERAKYCSKKHRDWASKNPGKEPATCALPGCQLPTHTCLPDECCPLEHRQQAIDGGHLVSPRGLAKFGAGIKAKFGHH